MHSSPPGRAGGKPPAVLLQRFSVTYPPGAPGLAAVAALHEIGLEVAPGEVVLVLGPSGSGKSTLCHALAGLIPRMSGGETSGSILVAGVDPREAPAGSLAGAVQIVFQEPETALFNMAVLEEILFSLEVAGHSYDQALPLARQALAEVGLQGLEERAVSGLSGGEKARLAVASALAPRPALVVVDEALSDVDPSGRVAILALLRQAAEAGAGILMTDSEGEDPAGVADRVVLLVEGTFVAAGVPGQLLGDPELLARHRLRPPQLALLGARMGLGFWNLEGGAAALEGRGG